MSNDHQALWLTSPRAALQVGPATPREPAADEVIVRARAIAMNPIDAMGAVARRVVLPWLRYPAVLGYDVAGEVTAVGSGVTALRVGDRVVGFAAGLERSRNSAAEGAFQSHVTLLANLCSPLPDDVEFEQAAVLPLALTTAAAGLYEADQLALPLPTATAPDRGETVLIFGAATSVGMNAVQLARNSGYRVVATASRQNFELITTLGATAMVDYNDDDMVQQLIDHLAGHTLVGTMAIASGSLTDAIAVSASPAVTGTRRVASAHPTPVTAIRARFARRRGVQVTAIWGGRPLDTAVGPAVWSTFLPAALAEKRYVTAPQPIIVGHGLEAIPEALVRMRAGVRAAKLVVTL